MATNQNSWWRTPLLHRFVRLHQREDQIFLVLALVIGALTGLAVVAFIGEEQDRQSGSPYDHAPHATARPTSSMLCTTAIKNRNL